MGISGNSLNVRHVSKTKQYIFVISRSLIQDIGFMSMYI